MKNLKTKEITLCALFASLTAILSQITIPIGPVPVNFAHLSTFLAAGLLGSRLGALSQLTFVLMGAAGLPVFSGFNGGLTRIAGPTGGYIIGYVVSAYVTGWVLERFGKRTVKTLALSILAGWLVTYSFGTLWFSYITHTSFTAALSLCVIPFLPGDLLKTCITIVLVRRLYSVFQRTLQW
ncbi:MAG: biotin transporter BioY [Paenibacillaceae bacterium]|nr:biotin transporter BioY [Paenibacillaceae bacterium]